jgi:hypothetical protein
MSKSQRLAFFTDELQAAEAYTAAAAALAQGQVSDRTRAQITV